MKSRLMILFLALAIFPLGTCFATTKLPASCGSDDDRFDVKVDSYNHPAGTIVPGKALVYLIGEGTPALGQETVRVGIDGAWVGANYGASYFSVAVDPGEHHLCMNLQSTFGRLSKQVALDKFTAEAGKVYFFRVKIDFHNGNAESMSWLDLVLVNSDEGEYLVSVLGVSSSQKRK